MSLSAPSESKILSDVSGLLGDLRGDEFSGGIEPGTRFFADLGLASIDAVVLGEALERHYGRPLPYVELMADLGRRADRDLTIGELVAFLGRSL